MARRSLF